MYIATAMNFATLYNLRHYQVSFLENGIGISLKDVSVGHSVPDTITALFKNNFGIIRGALLNVCCRFWVTHLPRNAFSAVLHTTVSFVTSVSF